MNVRPVRRYNTIDERHHRTGATLLQTPAESVHRCVHICSNGFMAASVPVLVATEGEARFRVCRIASRNHEENEPNPFKRTIKYETGLPGTRVRVWFATIRCTFGAACVWTQRRIWVFSRFLQQRCISYHMDKRHVLQKGYSIQQIHISVRF